MTKRMLIDSTHAEETRVVVLDGNRLEDFDVETSTKQQLKGNIYLAKIVRVEPSLQAAFVEFGGGRHGFLAFGEIHPDYYQIPVADRKRLLEMQEAEAREEEEEEEREAQRQERGRRGRDPQETEPTAETPEDASIHEHQAPVDIGPADEAEASADHPSDPQPLDEAPPSAEHSAEIHAPAEPPPLPHPDQVAQPLSIAQDIMVAPEEAQALFGDPAEEQRAAIEPAALDPETPAIADPSSELPDTHEAADTLPPVETPEAIGGEHETEEDGDERQDRRSTPRFLRNYKIQEVMRRRQILLVQVVKEERGSKGAALTTYISLAGRFSVLMPNSPRGGGISRKITSAADRRRLKEITTELDLPRGMGLIVRTAGANRPKPEIIRDCEYLLGQWDQIRDLTMKSMAPALIYEEASLIKRAIRDVYSRDVDDILVDGEDGWRAARDFMRMLMPTHAKKVQLWKDPQPLFAKAQVESQLDAMLLPNVQLRSGGYLVINQTEALVAIDVNSGRSTRERGIEETALRTNMEAAEEAARQLRLRDLAGLIVIDFIDMESRRNNAAVEKRLKDALKNDRARIQVGSISHFGLLEMSRQRLRPSLAETSFVTCSHCGGSGLTRGTESAALSVLRGIEDEGGKRRSAEIVVHVAGVIALYILNHKRVRLGEIEQRFGLHVTFQADETLRAPEMRIERLRAAAIVDGPAPISQLPPPEAFEDPDEEVETEEAAPADTTTEAAAEPSTDDSAADDADDADRPGETAEEGEQRRKRRRRRRRGGRREEGAAEAAPGSPAQDGVEGEAPDATGMTAETTAEAAPGIEGAEPAEGATGEDGERKRRGRRGGRRRRRGEGAPGEETADGEAAPEQSEAAVPTHTGPAYTGPTPADPFGGANAFDFFDAVEQPEKPRPAPLPAPALPDVVAVESAAAEATVPHPEPEPALSTAPAPTLVDAAPAEKKRGWWRK